MFWQLTLESGPQGMHHVERLHVGAAVASYRWDDYTSGPPELRPDLTGCAMAWTVEDRSPWEVYSERVRNWGKQPSQRCADLAERWADAKGVLLMESDKYLWVHLKRPPSAPFELFMLSNYLAGKRLYITLAGLHFVERDDVAAAPLRGFLERNEPAFLSEWPRYSFHQPGEVEEYRRGDVIMRHGRPWQVPVAEEDLRR